MKFFQKVLILLVLSLMSYLPSVAENYRFGNLNINNGLSDNQVNCIFKDSKGFMWFGNRNGLNRYDGFKIKTFLHDKNDLSSLVGNYVLSVNESLDGRLWIITFSGLVIFDPQTEKFYRTVSDVYPILKFNEQIINYCTDANKNVWLVGSRKVYRYCFDGKTPESVLINPKTTALNGQITSVQSKGNRLWFLYHNGFVEELDYKTLRIVKQYNKVSSGVNLHNDMRIKLFVDKDNDLWVYSLGLGIYHFNRTDKVWTRFTKNNGINTISSDIVNQISQDQKGLIWIATDQGGVNIYNKVNKSMQYLLHNSEKEFSLSHNSIQCVYCDDLGIVWLGTFKQGLNFYHPNFFKFELDKAQPSDKTGFPFNDINTFLEDKSGNIWFGSNGSGLAVKNKITNKYVVYKHDAHNSNSIPSNVIVSLKNDSKGRIWIGTYSGGLSCFDGRKFINYQINASDQNTISNNNIWDIVFEPNGNMWLATLGGGVDGFSPDMKKIAHFDVSSGQLKSDYVLSLTLDYPNLIIGTAIGLNTYNLQKQHFVKLVDSPKGEKELAISHINLVFKDSRGLYWIGTAEGLDCYNPKTKEFLVYTEKDGLPDNVIHTLVEDEKSHLWISTVKGVCRIELAKEKNSFKPNFTIYNENDGLQHGSLNLKAALRTTTNYIYFGGTDGINYFKSKDLNEKIYEGNIVFTDFQIYNHSVQPGVPFNGHQILDKSITSTDKIKLSYSDNFFSIEFAALNYFLPKVTHYQYKLEGFNSQWIKTNENSHLATFTNLSPGTYTFLVKAVYKGGQLSRKTGSLTIVVLPPWWLSGIAITVYVLLFILLAYYAYRIVLKRIADNKQKMEAEKEHRLDEMKLQFFTNISHEFRTPLTLILTPLEKLISQTYDTHIRGQLEMMNRNAKQLLTLVNQVLDFRKLEFTDQEVICTKGDFVEFVKELFVSFDEGFDRKNITAKFSSPVKSLWVNSDIDKFRKIITNLLSNALKFTPENGEVKLDILVDLQPESRIVVLRIDVIDTGIGIAEEHQQRIFDSFYQVPQSTQSPQGSGIGLHLVKKYVELMSGTIDLKSEFEKGSTFSLTVPLELIESSVNSVVYAKEINNKRIVKKEDNILELPVLLIVDDNDDVRSILRDSLENIYYVVEAENGQKGLELAQKLGPELIISDLMMPVMDGMEMSRALKADIRTSHIPILMLTAKVSDETKIQSLQVGIEDYITKPFNMETLLLKVQNVKNRQYASQQTFQAKMEISTKEIQISSLDEKLIQKAIALVEDNISNADFSVEELSQLLSMSRVNLYKKMLAITGKSPIEFIRIIRLKRSVQLLEKSQLSIAEIAYEVGFNTPRYFSKYFKEEYKLTPTEYREKLQSVDNVQINNELKC